MRETPAIESLRSLLERQLRAIESAESGIRQGLDPEHLHRFRVATRRARALIRAARPLIRDQLSSVDRELRWLGGASGPVRDLDVLIDHLHDLIDELEPDQAGGEVIIAALERDRLQQMEVLLKAIDSNRYRELLARFEEALPSLMATDGDVGLEQLAAKELRRLRAAYEELGPDPSDDQLHAVRIKAKHARYAAELAAHAEGRPLAALAEAIRDLQDLIGAHQDAVVAEQRVRALAREGSRVAAGRIVEIERRRREEARAKLPDVWKRVDRSARKAFEEGGV
jgi:CHAD domain-containing protein